MKIKQKYDVYTVIFEQNMQDIPGHEPYKLLPFSDIGIHSNIRTKRSCLMEGGETEMEIDIDDLGKKLCT